MFDTVTLIWTSFYYLLAINIKSSFEVSDVLDFLDFSESANISKSLLVLFTKIRPIFCIFCQLTKIYDCHIQITMILILVLKC